MTNRIDQRFQDLNGTPAFIAYVCAGDPNMEKSLEIIKGLNPIYTYGFEKFHADATAAGADGVLLLDLPPDEAKLNEEFNCTAGLKQITLIAPTSPDERIQKLAKQSEGFIYALSRSSFSINWIYCRRH